MACALWGGVAYTLCVCVGGGAILCFYDSMLAKLSTVLLNAVPLPFLAISHHAHPTTPSHLSPIPIVTHCQEGQPPKSHFNSARHRQRLVDPAASKVSVSRARRRRGCMATRSVCGKWGCGSVVVAFSGFCDVGTPTRANFKEQWEDTGSVLGREAQQSALRTCPTEIQLM